MDSVLALLQAFPRASSPGASQLKSQHLFDAILGTTNPSAKQCLNNLTCLANFLLSGCAVVSRLCCPAVKEDLT